MISKRIIEGTGEEIAEFAQQHPRDRFQLIVLSEPDQVQQHGPGSPGWEEMMQFIHSLKGKMGNLPLEATSTEALYD